MSNSIYVLNIQPVGDSPEDNTMLFSSQKRALEHGLFEVENKGGVLDSGFTGDSKRHKSLFFTGSDDVYYYASVTKRTVF